MHLFRTAPIEAQLAARSMGAKAQAKYLMASFMIFMVPGYLSLIPSSAAPYTVALGLEAWFYVCITVLGVAAARDAAGGDSNQHFITEFTCVYVPIAITTLLGVWSIHWLVIFAFGDTLALWSWSGTQFTENLRNIGMELPGFVALLAQVASNALIYWRVCRSMRRIATLR